MKRVVFKVRQDFVTASVSQSVKLDPRALDSHRAARIKYIAGTLDCGTWRITCEKGQWVRTASRSTLSTDVIAGKESTCAMRVLDIR